MIHSCFSTARARVVLLIAAVAGARVAAAAEGGIVGEAQSLVLTEPAPEGSAERRVEAADLATTPRSSADDLLRLVPGLLISRHGAEGKGRQIFLRGFDAAHGADLEVTLGGVPWNEASNVHGQGYLDLGTLIPEALVAVEAHKGSFRLEQGPFATAGSVDFELGVAPDRRGVRVGYEIGGSGVGAGGRVAAVGWGRHRVLASLSSGDGGSFLVAEALHDGGYGRNRDTDRAALLGRITLWADASQRLEWFGGGHVARFGEPGTVPLGWQRAGRVGFYDSLGPDSDSASLRAFGALRWSRAHASGGSSTALLHAQVRRLRLDENFTGFLLEPERGDRLDQRHRSAGVGLRLAHQRPLPGHLHLLAGLDLAGERIDQTEDRIDGQRVRFARTRALAGEQTTLGGRAGAVWLPARWLRVEGGLRAQLFAFDVAGIARDASERSAGRSFSAAWLPRVQAVFYPRPELSFLFAYGRGVRPPEAGAALGRPVATADADLSVYRGGDPRPTLSDGMEVGARFHPDRGLDLGLGAFATFIAREQVFDHLTGTNLERSPTRRLGVEADAGWRPLPWLALRGDVSAVQARFVESRQPVPGAPTLFASLESRAEHASGLSGGGRFYLVGPRPLAHGARAGALSALDLLLRYRRGAWELSLSIENLLGTRLREGEFNYASWFDPGEARSLVPRVHYAAGPPRTLHAGISAGF